MKTIILVCGFQGTGKSTLSKEIAARVSTAYFLDADKFYITQGGMPKNSDKLSDDERTRGRERYIAAKTAEIERLLRIHDTIITDGLFTHKKDRLFIKNLALKTKSRVITIRITCPEDIVKKRIFAQKEHILRPKQRWSSYLRTKKEWENIEDTHITIDSNKDIDYALILHAINPTEQ